MKTTITTVVLCLGIINASAQQLKEAEVPAKVKSAFDKKYPGSKVKEWEKIFVLALIINLELMLKLYVPFIHMDLEWH